MKITDIQDGDTFLVRTDAFLSKEICKVMTHWSKKRGFPAIPMYSHAARFQWLADDLYLFGSVDNGYHPILFNLHYNWNDSDFAVMRRKKPLSDEEKKLNLKFMLHLDTLSISYQYWNFVQWLLLVYLGINTFGNDTERFLYCYEAERRARKNLNPESYGNVSKTDIFDLLYDPLYEVIYKSKQ